MRKLLVGVLIGFVVAGMLSAGTILVAQERRGAAAVTGPLVVLGGLKMKEEANIEEAEKLLKEQLIPEMVKIEGLEMKVLKRLKTPWFQAADDDTGVYDYIMMAEVEKPEVLMQLMQGTGAGLQSFGDTMKKYAGHPYINIYTILAKTEK
jgi:hypothetical protein